MVMARPYDQLMTNAQQVAFQRNSACNPKVRAGVCHHQVLFRTILRRLT